MAFWTESLTGLSKDPKRNFRFKVTITSASDGQFKNAAAGAWYAKSADQPIPSISDTGKHDFLTHTFYFPGKVTWNEVSIELVDPVDPHLSLEAFAAIAASGYSLPANPSEPYKSISKGKSVAALGTVKVEQIDADGKPLHTWTLNNAFIKEASLSKLDYSNEDLTTLTLKLRYDWATFEGLNGENQATYWKPGQQPQ